MAEAHGLTKQHGGKTAAVALTSSIRLGAVTGLPNPNGAGTWA
jgi:ABC-type branched-subunit amino acid transport system ATPase component